MSKLNPNEVEELIKVNVRLRIICPLCGEDFLLSDFVGERTQWCPCCGVNFIAVHRTDRTTELERQNAILRKIIEEALEPGVFGIQDRSGISTPEDSEVFQLGLRIGFGALMDSASRMWAIWAKRNGYAGSEFVTGPCAAVRDAWVKKAQAVLAEIEEETK